MTKARSHAKQYLFQLPEHDENMPTHLYDDIGLTVTGTADTETLNTTTGRPQLPPRTHRPVIVTDHPG